MTEFKDRANREALVALKQLGAQPEPLVPPVVTLMEEGLGLPETLRVIGRSRIRMLQGMVLDLYRTARVDPKQAMKDLGRLPALEGLEGAEAAAMLLLEFLEGEMEEREQTPPQSQTLSSRMVS